MLALDRRVERLMQLKLHTGALDADQRDAAEEIYTLLLTAYTGDLEGAVSRGEENFILLRLISNVYRSCNSSFHYTYRSFRRRCADVTNLDFTINGQGKAVAVQQGD